MQHKNSKIIPNINYTSIDNEGLEVKTKPLLDLSRTIAKDIFTSKTRPWEALTKLHRFICDRGIHLPYDQYDEISENVWVHISAYLAPSAKIEGPTIICGGAKICHNCHISGSIVGSFATVGDMSQVKNSILFDRSRLNGNNVFLHSILGYESIICHNTVTHDSMCDGLNINVEVPEGIYITGRSRLGAIICDSVYIKPMCVIEPGCIIDYGSGSSSLVNISGYYPPRSSI